jgi:hypothetical protein
LRERRPANAQRVVDRSDPQANLTMALGVKPGSLRRMIGDVLLDQSSLGGQPQRRRA